MGRAWILSVYIYDLISRLKNKSYDVIARCLTRVHNRFILEIGDICYFSFKNIYGNMSTAFETDMRTLVNFIRSIYEDSDTVKLYMWTIY